jgi:hypothetical protein
MVVEKIERVVDVRRVSSDWPELEKRFGQQLVYLHCFELKIRKA